MTDESLEHAARSEDLALAVYLAELVAHRRVLWIGPPSVDALTRVKKSARKLKVLAPDGTRKRGRRGPRVSKLVPGPLELDEGAWDVAVVPDASAVAFDEPERVAELRRIVGDEGVLVMGAVADGSLSYESLYDLVGARFDVVRMLGQAAFDGWSVVDFGSVEGDYDVTVDGSAVEEDTPPARYVAVGASTVPSLDAVTLVRVPLRQAAPEVAPPPPEVDTAELEERLSKLQRETDAASDHSEALESQLSDRSRELARARELIEQAAARCTELEKELAAGQERPDYDLGDDLGRLEEELRLRGQELREVEEEVDRRGTLVRDMVEEMRELRAVAAAARSVPEMVQPEKAEPSDQSGVRDRDLVLARALEAEAGRVEANYQIDELMGRVAAADNALEASRMRDAELVGTVRGLRARLYEQEEQSELAQGRLVLLESDLEAAAAEHRATERELAEVREQFELELVRARGSGDERKEDLRVLRARVDELEGELVERAGLLAQAERERDHARSEMLRLTALVSSMEMRYEGARRGYDTRIAELSQELTATERDVAYHRSAASEQVDSLRGELEGVRARLADREAALLARTETDAGTTNKLRDDADNLRADIAELRESEGDKTVKLAEAEELLELEAGRAMDLASTVAARDALITRLQMDLAEEEQRTREHDQKMKHAHEENARLRDALIQASERVDQVEGLSHQAEELDRVLGVLRGELESVKGDREGAIAERDAALATRDASGATLRETRRILSALMERFGEDGPTIPRATDITAVGMDVPDGGGSESALAGAVDASKLEEQVTALTRQAEDRETLLHSLTAQLEDRDDRIRTFQARAATPGGDGAGAGSAALRHELKDLQEKAARLSEELLHERKARQDAVSRAQQSASASTELERLEEAVGDKDAQVLTLQTRVSASEREVKTLREAAAQARSSLEELLGNATSSGDPAAAERLGALIRILGGG